MPIAEEIYAKVQTLPDELAREVLDFVHFIEERYALRPKAEPPLRRMPGSAKGKLKILNEDNDHLLDFKEVNQRDGLYPLATQQIDIDLDDRVTANYPKFDAAIKKTPGLGAQDE